MPSLLLFLHFASLYAIYTIFTLCKSPRSCSQTVCMSDSNMLHLLFAGWTPCAFLNVSTNYLLVPTAINVYQTNQSDIFSNTFCSNFFIYICIFVSLTAISTKLMERSFVSRTLLRKKSDERSQTVDSKDAQ